MKKQMKIKKTLLAVLMAGTIGLAGNALYACPHEGSGAGYQCKHGKHGHGKHGMSHASPEKRVEKMAVRLGLSDAQKQQVLALMTTNQTNMKPLRKQKRALKHSLYTLNPGATDYTTQLTNLADQKASLVRQMILAKGQNRQQLFKLLTPEQQSKMLQMHTQQMQKKMAH